MEAHDKSFSFMGTQCYYDIPFFQRAYVWDKDNWQELMENLTSRSQNHFLGSIILKVKPTSAGDVERRFVIDGQQRLTTLSILLRACMDHLIDNNADYGYDESAVRNLEVKADQLLYVYKGVLSSSRNIKIHHSQIDREYYEKVLNGEYKKNWEDFVDCDDEIIVSRIVKAYAFFRDYLRDKDSDTLKQIFDLLTEDKVRFLVSIDLKENDNEQAIFNTVNSSGVILSGADIIKNLLYERYVDLLRQEKTNSADVDKYAIKIYKSTWESAFLADEKVDAYWNAKRQYGRMTRSNLETFLYSFAVIKGFFNPAEDNAIDLSKKYKEKVDSFDRKHLEKFLAELSEYADIYQDNFIMGKDELTYDDYVRRLFVICGALEVATFYPYLLQLLYQHEKGKIDNNEMKAKFFALERYIVANAICRGSTKNYNNECVQLVQNRKDPDDIFEGCVYLTKDQFKSGLRHMKLNKVPTVLLFCVELYKRKTSKSDIKKLSYNFTLEHIMPQKWEKNWSDVTVKNQEGKTIKDKDEIEKIRKYTIYQIGNMTLLNSKLNSSVSNGTFKEKVYGKNGKPGLKAQADLMLTKEVIDQHKKWDDIAVYSRTEVLEDIIAKMWNLSGLPEEKEVVQKKNSTSFKSLRKEYWEFALDKLNKSFGDESPYANRNATDDSWMSGKVGVSGFRVNCVFVDDEARVEIALRNRDIKKNKEAFEYLLSKKTRIEKDLGVKLTWSPASKDKKKAMISYSCLDVSIADKETWDAAADFHAEWAKNMCDVILPYLQELYPQISW